MKKPVVKKADHTTPMFDVGVETSPGMRAFLPTMTWPEVVALRDELTRFLSDSRNAEGTSP
jgi:hypothetical protein